MNVFSFPAAIKRNAEPTIICAGTSTNVGLLPPSATAVLVGAAVVDAGVVAVVLLRSLLKRDHGVVVVGAVVVVVVRRTWRSDEITPRIDRICRQLN